jgi:drug/metabolite transporter (DMT)-like permease
LKHDVLILILVLFAAALHASWNALLKWSGDRDRLLTLAVMIGTGGLVCLIGIPFVPLPESVAWRFLATSVVLHVGYYVFLIRAYRGGDLSQVYPIARGVGPLLVAFSSATLVGESLTITEFLGVLVICCGIASLALSGLRWERWGESGGQRETSEPEDRQRASRHPVVFAVVTGVFIAGYTIVDGLGVRATKNPLSYILWMNFLEGLPLLFFALAARPQEFHRVLRNRGRSAALAGVLAALAYGLVVWAYSMGMIAPIAALRETSVVMAAWSGTRLMHDPFGTRRIVAAAVVVAGIVLLNLRL